MSISPPAVKSSEALPVAGIARGTESQLPSEVFSSDELNVDRSADFTDCLNCKIVAES